jgi:hypothetical protein
VCFVCVLCLCACVGLSAALLGYIQRGVCYVCVCVLFVSAYAGGFLFPNLSGTEHHYSLHTHTQTQANR